MNLQRRSALKREFPVPDQQLVESVQSAGMRTVTQMRGGAPSGFLTEYSRWRDAAGARVKGKPAMTATSRQYSPRIFAGGIRGANFDGSVATFFKINDHFEAADCALKDEACQVRSASDRRLLFTHENHPPLR
jgi:hypothetical protein